VILPDLCGLGESEARTTMSIARYAEDTHALLRQLDTGPVVLIGHSMGGYVALAFAREFGEALRGLVLVGTNRARIRATLRPVAERRRRRSPGGFGIVVDAMAPKMLSPRNGDRGWRNGSAA